MDKIVICLKIHFCAFQKKSKRQYFLTKFDQKSHLFIKTAGPKFFVIVYVLILNLLRKTLEDSIHKFLEKNEAI